MTQGMDVRLADGRICNGRLVGQDKPRVRRAIVAELDKRNIPQADRSLISDGVNVYAYFVRRIA